MDWIIISAFVLSFLIQLAYYLFLFLKAARKSKGLDTQNKDFPPVSVIICAKNEAQNLRENLPHFLEQDYPEFEVIVVNDNSEDETDQVLANFKSKYQNLRISNINSDTKLLRGKKLALTLGIKAASFDIVLLSDADCIPATNQWIKYISRNFIEDKSLVLGIGLYKKKKGFLNLLIRFETAFIAMQYSAMALAGKTYMGVGRNLAYKKELFFKNKGFANHLKLESGDDDLFVNEVSTSKNTLLEKHVDSFTYSEPENSWKNWLRQKKRHLSSSSSYKTSSRYILGIEYFTRMLLLLSFVLLLIRLPYYLYILGIYLFLLLIKGITFNNVFKGLTEKFLFLPSIIMEPLMPWLYGILHILNFIERKKNRWN